MVQPEGTDFLYSKISGINSAELSLLIPSGTEGLLLENPDYLREEIGISCQSTATSTLVAGQPNIVGEYKIV